MTKLDRALHAQHELRVIAIMITPGEFPGRDHDRDDT